MFFSKGIKLINTIAKIEVLRGGTKSSRGTQKKLGALTNAKRAPLL